MDISSQIIWQDAQHQLLFRLIEEIKHEQLDPAIFQRLHDYAEYHFSLEEQYMEALRYPDAAEHIRAHNKFRQQLAEMVASRDQYDEPLRQSLSMFLNEWLRRHIMGIDKKFEYFVLESDRK